MQVKGLGAAPAGVLILLLASSFYVFKRVRRGVHAGYKGPVILQLPPSCHQALSCEHPW